MRFMQIMTFYEQYLHRFHEKHPQLLEAGHDAILQHYINDGFGGMHVFAPGMAGHGYETRLVIGNDVVGQCRWAREHGVAMREPGKWLHEIVKHQVELFRPDVLFVSDVIVYSGDFLRELDHRPGLVIGWRGADIPKGLRLAGYDILLSHQTKLLEAGLRHGVRQAERFLPGFPAWIAEQMGADDPVHDLVVSMQWNPQQHQHRNSLINFLLRASGGGKRFGLGLYLAALGNAALPPGVAALNQGPRFGLDMYRTLRAGRMVFNAESDLNRGEAGNMRLFEGTGVGRLVLTEAQPNLDRYFKPGDEIETFASEAELLEKVIYYSRHPETAAAIARRGQARCLAHYSLDRAVERLDGRIRHWLDKTQHPAAKTPAAPALPASPITGRNTVAEESRVPVDMLVQGYDAMHVDTRRFFGSRRHVSIFRCLESGYRFYHPFSIAGDGDFYRDLSRGIPYYMEWKWEHQQALEGIAPGERVLEIGCARGEFLDRLQREGHVVVGLEDNDAARQEALAKGLDVRCATVRDLAAEQGPAGFDAVVMFQVLEHIADVKTFLDDLLVLLRPGGKLFIGVPNNDSFLFREDPVQMLNRPPHHVGLWNLEALISLGRFFPLRIDKALFEPLQAYHHDWLIAVARKHVAKNFGEQTLRRIDETKAFATFCEVMLPNFQGHTIFAQYRKTTSPAGEH
ncbi:glycosyltransferase family protein [Solidesulfovibrio sp.]